MICGSPQNDADILLAACDVRAALDIVKRELYAEVRRCADRILAPLLLTPRLLLGVASRNLGPCGERQSASVERRTMEVRSQGAASSDVADRGRGANRCGACSDVDEANDSPRRSCRERIAISLRPSRKEDDEGKQNSYHSALRTDLLHATTMITPTATSGAPRGRTRASTRVPTSTPRCRYPPRSRSVEGNPPAI